MIDWLLRLFLNVLEKISLTMATRLLRKYNLSDQNERDLLWNKLNKEIIKLENWFKQMISPLTTEKVNMQIDWYIIMRWLKIIIIIFFVAKDLIDFSPVTVMGRIIKSEDVDFLGVEIGSLVKKCPNITTDMLFAILSMRGDISKSDYKDVYLF